MLVIVDVLLYMISCITILVLIKQSNKRRSGYFYKLEDIFNNILCNQWKTEWIQQNQTKAKPSVHR